MNRWSFMVVREVIAGIGGVTCALAAAVLCPAGEPAPRALAMTAACGILTTLLTDWRAVGVVVTACVLTYGFVLTSSTSAALHPSSW